MDLIATVLLGLGLLAAAGAALFMSPFLVMATDSAGDNPRTAMLVAAYAVTWGGTAAGVLGALAGLIRAAGREQPMWIWPALGIAVIGVSFAVGVALATKVVRRRGGPSG